MAQTITLDEIKHEATQRGYEVQVNSASIRVAKKQFAHVSTSFSLTDFRLDSQHAEDYALLQSYYWLRGYHLIYGDDGTFELQRGMLHPHFEPQTRVAKLFDYHYDAGWELTQLHQVMLCWVNEIESTN